MKLYFLRHATANDIAASDHARELTIEGEEEARIAGAALAKLGAKPSRIYCSPLRRARQTAEIAARAMRFPGTTEQLTQLENGASTHALLKALKSSEATGEILLIGHMPSLAEHISAFVAGASAEGFPIGKAGMVCVEVEQLQIGAGQLRWMMRQAQLREVVS